MVQKVKHLEVHVDSSLDLTEEIKVIPDSSLKSLYFSIIEPHFRYCCSVWGCSGANTLLELQKLQCRAASV